MSRCRCSTSPRRNSALAGSERVQSNAAVETVQNLRLKPGPHVVTIRALDPGFALDRLELAFVGAPRAYGPGA